MKQAERDDLIRSIGTFISEAVAKAVAPLRAEIAALEQNLIQHEFTIGELKAREPIKGDKGEQGDMGAPGGAGKDGKDGVNLAGALIDKSGSLVLTLSNGEVRNVGLVVGQDGNPGAPGIDGAPGADGAPGLGFDDMEVIYDGLRNFTFRMKRGEAVKDWSFNVPFPLYARAWKDGNEYKEGDLATWDGSLWHCDIDEPGKPGTPGGGWTLAIKRGQDGKHGKDGDKGLPGRDGKDALEFAPLLNARAGVSNGR